MSNEQAKSELMQIYMSLSEEKKKALDMAFKAMEQADGEYISRQDAIKAIEEKAKRIKNEDTLNGLAGAIAILFDLPSYNSIKTELSGDLIQRQAVLEYIEGSEAELGHRSENELVCQYINELPSVKPQESSITWVTGADGAKIAFWDVPVWKVTKICEILGEPQERSEE